MKEKNKNKIRLKKVITNVKIMHTSSDLQTQELMNS